MDQSSGHSEISRLDISGPAQDRSWALITNRWSSRLRRRQELRVLTRKEPRLPVLVGGAAQLYVMFIEAFRKVEMDSA